MLLSKKSINVLGTRSRAPAAALASAGTTASWSALRLPPFPKLLAIGRWVVLGFIAVSCLTWFSLARTVDAATHTIGHDTTTSIVAAESIRTLLADADGQLANIMLSAKGQDGPFVSALRQDVRGAESLIIDAALNITFGDEEKGPLTTMSRGLAEFEQLVGIARAHAEDGKSSGNEAREADTLMHFTILPAAAALDRVNLDHLTEGYESYQRGRGRFTALAVLLAAAALVLLVALQILITRKTKRLLNLGLAAATVIVAFVMVGTIVRFLAADAALRVTKQDAFDSIAALTMGRALANDAHAAESYWLLAHGDPAAQAALDATFQVRAGRLLRDPAQAAARMAHGDRLEGLLGDELANITFEGEAAVADATVQAWLAYLAIDQQIRALERGGRTVEAVALTVGSAPGQSNWAFARFTDALDQTIAINQRAFDDAVARSEASVGRPLYLTLLAAWILASAAVWIGVRARLKEYEF